MNCFTKFKEIKNSPKKGELKLVSIMCFKACKSLFGRLYPETASPVKPKPVKGKKTGSIRLVVVDFRRREETNFMLQCFDLCKTSKNQSL